MAKFLGRAGFNANDLDFAAQGESLSFAFVAIPEPAALALAGMALAAAIPVCRRRHSPPGDL